MLLATRSKASSAAAPTQKKNRRARPLGLVLWKGPSPLTGDDIVVIANGFARKSKNTKLGGLVQTWILRADMSPTEALVTRKDDAVCGDCPSRNICYVTVQYAPQAVWKAWKAGTAYVPLTRRRLDWFNGTLVRWGSYGDPGLIPFELMEKINGRAASWVGYTHLWHKRRFQRYRRYLMASAETAEIAELAHRRGWRTFRSRGPDEPLLPNEFRCPASEEEGFRRKCETCMACNGLGGRTSSRKVSPAIVFHGGRNVTPAAFAKSQQAAHRRLSLPVLA